MRKLTKKQVENYIKNPDKCPLCKGLIVVEDDFDEQGGNREVTCSQCDTRFYEIYTLINLEIAN